MGRRSHTQRLNIWLNGTPVAYWDASAGRHTLTYFEEWSEDRLGRPLSLSLPFQPGNAPYRGQLVQNYFDNLLPDSDAIRRRLAQHFRTAVSRQQLDRALASRGLLPGYRHVATE